MFILHFIIDNDHQCFVYIRNAQVSHPGIPYLTSNSQDAHAALAVET